MLHITILSALLAVAPVQGVSPAPVSPTADVAREERYLRQQVAVDNARITVETLRAELKLKNELLELGRVRNAELYKIAHEILERHGKQRSWEPFIQASNVSLENAVQSYEDRLRAARVTEATLPPSVDERMQRDLAKTPADASASSANTGPK